MRDVLRWDPFRELEAAAAGDYGLFAPSFDVKENKEGYVFRADLPGVHEDDLEISLTGNRLTISGKREQEKARPGRDLLRQRTFVRQLQPRVHASRRHRRRQREGRAEGRRTAGDRPEEAGSPAERTRCTGGRRASTAAPVGDQRLIRVGRTTGRVRITGKRHGSRNYRSGSVSGPAKGPPAGRGGLRGES